MVDSDSLLDYFYFISLEIKVRSKKARIYLKMYVECRLISLYFIGETQQSKSFFLYIVLIYFRKVIYSNLKRPSESSIIACRCDVK
jgi:hypothetical protein